MRPGAPLIGLDRQHFESLLATAIEAAIHDEQIPAFVLIRDGSTVISPPLGVHNAKMALRQWRDAHSSQLVVLRELTRADLRRYTEAEIVEALLLVPFITARQLVRSSIALAIAELAGRGRRAIDEEIARRSSNRAAANKGAP